MLEKKFEEQEGEEQEEEEYNPWDLGDYESQLGLDSGKAYYLFFDANIKLVGHVEAIEFDKFSGKMTSSGSAAFFDKTITQKEEDAEGNMVDVEVRQHELSPARVVVLSPGAA